MRARDFQQVVDGELDERLLHVADRVVHGDGAHHERGFLDEFLAEEARLAGVGEIHDSVGAELLGGVNLLPFHVGVRDVARDAQVHVHLGGKAFAHAARFEPHLEVADVRRDGDAPGGDAGADELWVAVLALGDGAHGRRDDACACEVELRDAGAAVRAQGSGVDGLGGRVGGWVLRCIHDAAPFVGITHVRFCGSDGRAPSQPAVRVASCRCSLVLPASSPYVGSIIACRAPARARFACGRSKAATPAAREVDF